jgi:hypothetical protein
MFVAVGLTLIALATAVGLAQWGKDTESVKNIIGQCIHVFTFGSGAVIGLIGGKTAG